MSHPTPERNLYDILSSHESWPEVSTELEETLKPEGPSLGADRVEQILSLVPTVFSLVSAKNYYRIAFGGSFFSDNETAGMTRVNSGYTDRLSNSDVAIVLTRAYKLSRRTGAIKAIEPKK